MLQTKTEMGMSRGMYSLHRHASPCSYSTHLRARKLKPMRRTQITAALLSSPSPVLSQNEFLQMIQQHAPLAFSNPFAPVKAPPNFLETLTSNPVEAISQIQNSGFQFQGPSLFGVLGFLLANPLVSLVLAVALYILIPRLWRALVKFVFIPAGLIGAGIVVFKNPAFFTNAGSTIAGFSSDHPYVTSAAILGTLGIVLSPYVLTAVVLLLVFTGVPNLPAPLRGFLPAPFLEVEETLRSADSVIRGPVDKVKQQAFRAGDDFRDKGFDFLGKQLQSQPEASQLPEKR